MHSIIRQALSYEPESLWMSMLGLACALGLGPMLVLVAIALGWGR